MESIPESRPRSKKTKRLGPVRVIRPGQYEAFDVNSKVECIQALIPLGLMRIQELLEEEVRTLAGARYARKASHLPGYRHGSNPGSVQLAGQRHPFRIPRVQHVKGGEISLQSVATFAARASWMRACSSVCSMGFPAGTMKRQRQRSLGRLAWQARRCRGALRKPVRSSFRRSRTAT